MKINFRPPSWSAQARAMCDKQIELINNGYGTIQGAKNLFNISYRAEIIKYRAVKRFGRKYRAGKIQERPDLLKERFGIILLNNKKEG